MNSGFGLKTIIILLVAAVLVTSGCREHTLISSSLSPASDTAGVRADTLSCVTHSFFSNDVVTSFNASGVPEYVGVGSITDSFFGTTAGSAFFQIANSRGILSLDTSILNYLDSVVLQLPYSGFSFGDTVDKSLTQSFQVFYLDDTIGYNTIYTPSSTKAINIATPLSDPFTVKVNNLGDSVTEHNGTKTHPALRIKLKTANTMIRLSNAISLSSSATDPASAFVSNFAGICVRPTDPRVTGKVLPYFVLNGSDDYSKAGLLVFYHTYDRPDSARHFAFSHEQSLCAHFSNLTRGYSRFPLNNLFQSIQANDSIVALQNQPGATIDVKISGLNSIPKGVVINKAELQLSVIPSLTSSIYGSHDQIYPVGVSGTTWPVGNTAGSEYTVLDRWPLSSTSAYTVLDGTPHTITYGSTGITTYTIGMPREVIASIGAGNDSLHYHVRGTQLIYGAFRTILAGGNYSDPRYRAKLIVVYSTLKK